MVLDLSNLGFEKRQPRNYPQKAKPQFGMMNHSYDFSPVVLLFSCLWCCFEIIGEGG